MARDNQNKLSKKEQIKRSKRDDEKLLINNKKKNEESDGDNSEDESGDEMGVHEYRKKPDFGAPVTQSIAI